MIVGYPSVFAIESEISCAYESRGQMALGFFIIHLMGRAYGVRAPDATLMACSFDEVGRRIARSGSHQFSPFTQAEAGAVASAFRRAVYGERSDEEEIFGMSALQLRHAISSHHLDWAPDGDAAFDDSSYVLQMDEGDEVRLIAFAGTPGYFYDPVSLRECRLASEEFYSVLTVWHAAFEDEWTSLL